MIWNKMELRPRFYEVDSYGIVNNMYYMSWFEMGRLKIAQEAGILVPKVYEEGIMFVVSEAHIKYEKAINLWDKVSVETVVIPTETSAMRFKHKVRLSSFNSVMAVGESTTICLRKGQLLLKVPEWIAEKVGEYVRNVQAGVEE